MKIYVIYPAFNVNKSQASLLEKAQKNVYLEGYVSKEEKYRIFLFYLNQDIAFITPRREKDSWRIGACYCLKQNRNNAHHSPMIYLINFFIKNISEGKDIYEIVDISNLPMKSLLRRTGFRLERKLDNDLELWKREPNDFNAQPRLNLNLPTQKQVKTYEGCTL